MKTYKFFLRLCVLMVCNTGSSSAWSRWSNPPSYDHRVDLQTNRPLIIAHRGSSGVLPEHTVEAYTEALKQGADVIECDVCVTKDLKLLCLHESWMTSKTTNVDEVFPDRLTTKFVQDQGRNITAHFTVDFTLEEMKKIKVKQRFSFRDQRYNGQYDIATLDEYIQIAQSSRQRIIGVYPETKDPEWVNSLDILQNANTTFEDLLVDVLVQHGYTKPTDPCFVQSFSEASLRRLSDLTELPLIRLVQLTDPILSDEQLMDLSKFCYGVGPHKDHLIQVTNGYIVNTTDLASRVHKTGLKIHPYTFRNEDRYLALDYQSDPYNELKMFLDLKIDGYFTDFPGTLSNFLNVTYEECNGSGSLPSNGASCSTVIYLIVCVLFMIPFLK